ncbi:MAG: carbohydrate binding domain-containing protein, partial [Cryobacterium sp.]
MSIEMRALSRAAAGLVIVPALILPLMVGAAAPAAAASVSVLADFEGGTPEGFFAYGNAGFGVEDVAPGSANARPGQTDPTTVLSYGFDITPAGSFGGVGHNFATAGDWSSFEGVSFWLQGSGNGASLQFEIFDGGADSDSSERFDHTITDDVAGWREIQIPWASFTRATDFQPGGAPDDGLNLTTMWGYALPANSGADTVLVDDIELYSADDVTATATLSASSYAVIEGRTGEVEVRLNVAPTAPITVDYATSDGTAGADDYTTASGTLTFAAGETTQTIRIATTDDAVEEPNETLTVTLSNPVGAVLGTPSTATLTILDNDAAPVGPPAGRTLLVEDFEAPLPVGSVGAAGTVPVGWFAAQDPQSTVGFAATDALPVPVPADPPVDGNT